MILPRLLVALCAASAGVLTPFQAQSQGLVDQVKFGVLAHDVPNLWSGFRYERGGVDLNGELQFRPVLSLFGGQIRPVIGGSVHTGGATSRAYVDARIQWDLGPRFFFATGLGVGIHNGKLEPTDIDRKALGSRVLFHIPAEFGINLTPDQSISIYFEHFSNGGTKSVNEGIDAVGVRYGRKF